jgi:hypothetical protein
MRGSFPALAEQSLKAHFSPLRPFPAAVSASYDGRQKRDVGRSLEDIPFGRVLFGLARRGVCFTSLCVVWLGLARQGSARLRLAWDVFVPWSPLRRHELHR